MVLPLGQRCYANGRRRARGAEYVKQQRKFRRQRTQAPCAKHSHRLQHRQMPTANSRAAASILPRRHCARYARVYHHAPLYADVDHAHAFRVSDAFQDAASVALRLPSREKRCLMFSRFFCYYFDAMPNTPRRYRQIPPEDTAADDTPRPRHHAAPARGRLIFRRRQRRD